MNKKMLSVVLLIVSVGLAWYGYEQSQGFSNQLSRGLSGKMSGEVIAFYVAAAICAALGIMGLARK